MTDAPNPKFSLKRKFELLEKSLESRILYHRGVQFRHLAQERLARDLENEKETLARSLAEEKARLALLTQEWSRLKEEAAEEIGYLKNKCRALEEANLSKEKSLSAISDDIKNLRESLALLQGEKEVYRRTALENESLRESGRNLKGEIEGLKESLSAKSRDLDASLAKCALYLDTLNHAGLLQPDKTEPPSESPAAPSTPASPSRVKRVQDSLKRIAAWWQEPVTEINLPSFLTRKKDPLE